MPRDAAGKFVLPPGSQAQAGAPVLAATHNTPMNDIAFDLNVARPITTGGTGATTAAGARSNLGVPLAQTNPEDATPNSAMIVGAFGLGATARLSSDFGALPAGVSALYRTSTVNIAGAPDGNQYWATLHVSLNPSNTRAWDLAAKAAAPDQPPDVRVRVNDSTGPGPWYRVLTAGQPIEGVPIGQTTPAAGKFTSLAATGTLTVTGAATMGSINDTPIGGSTPRSGGFTSLAVANNATVTGNLTVAGTTSLAGFSAASGAISGALAVVGGATFGSINDTPIGGGTPRAGTFTSLSVTNNATVTGNVTVSGALNASGANLTALNASNVSTGTLDPARLPATSGGSTWVSGRLADIGAVGGVGSCVLARKVSAGNTAYLAQVAGSNLRPASASGADIGSALTGTWACLGVTNDSTDEARTTMWVRVA